MTLAYLGAAALRESYLAEWQKWQRQYRALLREKASDRLGRELLRNFRIELKQVSVPALHAVDRCVTCHTGIDDPRMANVPQPFTVHPGDILKNHPVDRFGCTICHQGQGSATTYRDAAHEGLEFWEQPLLTGDYLQAGCGKCHKEPSVPAAPMLSEARVLYTQEFACDACHRINQEGGLDCPDLTYIGSKPLRTFDFTHVQGRRSRPQWLFEHFRNPQAIVPDSEMPNVEMTDEQARAMTVLMLSLTDDRIPLEYLVPQPLRRPELAAASSDEGKLFHERGCLLCHPLRGQGGTLGPDLGQLTGQRNADWLFQHFKNPSRAAPGAKISLRALSDAEANEVTRYVLSLR